jgi:hypothetical protein
MRGYLVPSQVELFFKWIKQHLRIKAFFVTSQNAIKTQTWIAVSVYVLVAIVRKHLGLDASFTRFSSEKPCMSLRPPVFDVMQSPYKFFDSVHMTLQCMRGKDLTPYSLFCKSYR